MLCLFHRFWNKLPKGILRLASGAERMSERSGIFRKTVSALKEIWSLLPAVCSACNMHFFGHQVLILFWTHLPCFFSILSVCMPGLFCSAAFGLVRIAYCGRMGRKKKKKKNRAIKRFRNRAISNHDFILISINRTALHSTTLHTHTHNYSLAHTHTHSLSLSHTHTLYIHTHTHSLTLHTHTLPLAFVNINPQNDYLNMTSACLC